jgi:hypothetical protein
MDLPKDDNEWRWLYGIFLSVVALAVVGHDLIASCPTIPGAGSMSPGSCAEEWVYRYQTLAAGILASIAAFLTVRAIRDQIKQVYNIEEDRRQRREVVSRVKLLMALDKLSDHCDRCIRELTTLHYIDSSGRPVIRVPVNFNLPKLPNQAVDDIQGSIEYARKERINKIRGLLMWLQVQSARVRDDSNAKASIRGRDQAIFDAIQLKVLVNKLFNYARNRTEDITDARINADDFASITFFMNLREPEYEGVSQLIAQTEFSSFREYLE